MAWDEGYSESEQYQRLLRARKVALENSGVWEQLLSKLTEALPECKVEDRSVLFSDDNCWRVRVYLPEKPQLEEGERNGMGVDEPMRIGLWACRGNRTSTSCAEMVTRAVVSGKRRNSWRPWARSLPRSFLAKRR